jgi:hypothetical protein
MSEFLHQRHIGLSPNLEIIFSGPSRPGPHDLRNWFDYKPKNNGFNALRRPDAGFADESFDRRPASAHKIRTRRAGGNRTGRA